jgi:hypothetical protein
VKLLAAFAALLSLAAAARAAPPGSRDADWPCQQIKVPRLSLAALWSGPALDTQQDDWRQDARVAELVQVIAQRRVPIDQAEARIRAFATQAGDERQQKLLKALGGAFIVLDAERSSVISGLDRFGARQKELAATLREDNEKLRQLQADPASKPGEISDTVQRVTWEAAVFQDRRQALSYACDVPAKIEQRLFALARAIQDTLKE